MQHYFNVEFATKYGPKEAVLVYFLEEEFSKNNIPDMEQLLAHFIYWDKKTIIKILKSLKKQGLSKYNDVGGA